MANAEGISKAQDLVKQAIDADPNLQAKLKTVQDRVLFVTGKEGTAAVTGIDDITFRGKLEQLARDDIRFATEVKQLYADLKIAVTKKLMNLTLLQVQKYHLQKQKLQNKKLITTNA